MLRGSPQVHRYLHLGITMAPFRPITTYNNYESYKKFLSYESHRRIQGENLAMSPIQFGYRLSPLQRRKKLAYWETY